MQYYYSIADRGINAIISHKLKLFILDIPPFINTITSVRRFLQSYAHSF